MLVPPNLYIYTYIQYIYSTYYLGFKRVLLPPNLYKHTYIPSLAKTAATPFVAKCMRMYARVLVPPNLYIDTYIQYIDSTYYLGFNRVCWCRRIFNRVCWCRRIFTYIHTYSTYIVRTNSGLTACAIAAESLHTYIHTLAGEDGLHPLVAKCMRVKARVLVPPTLYIDTYIPSRAKG